MNDHCSMGEGCFSDGWRCVYSNISHSALVQQILHEACCVFDEELKKSLGMEGGSRYSPFSSTDEGFGVY